MTPEQFTQLMEAVEGIRFTCSLACGFLLALILVQGISKSL